MSRKAIDSVQEKVEAVAAALLPRYVVEKVNGVYEVYDTELAVVEDVFPGTPEGKETAEKTAKNLTKNKKS